MVGFAIDLVGLIFHFDLLSILIHFQVWIIVKSPEAVVRVTVQDVESFISCLDIVILAFEVAVRIWRIEVAPSLALSPEIAIPICIDWQCKCFCFVLG